MYVIYSSSLPCPNFKSNSQGWGYNFGNISCLLGLRINTEIYVYHISVKFSHKFILWEGKQDWTLHLSSWGEANGMWWNKSLARCHLLNPTIGSVKFLAVYLLLLSLPRDEFMKECCLQTAWLLETGTQNSSYGAIELRLLDFSIIFGVWRFEFWTNFKCNGTRRNRWLSDCLMWGLKAGRKSSWRWTGRNQAFLPCLSTIRSGNCPTQALEIAKILPQEWQHTTFQVKICLF